MDDADAVGGDNDADDGRGGACIESGDNDEEGACNGGDAAVSSPVPRGSAWIRPEALWGRGACAGRDALIVLGSFSCPADLGGESRDESEFGPLKILIWAVLYESHLDINQHH